MKQVLWLITGSILLILSANIFSGCINQNETPPPPTYTITEIASQIMYDFNASNFSGAFQFFNASLLEVINEQQIADIWHSIISTYGTFLGIESNRTTSESGYNVVYLTCSYSILGFLDTRFVFNTEKLVDGFQFVQTDLSYLYSPPDYADPTVFTEVNVTIGEDPWQLPGTLTFPNTGAESYPAVVLVQGSGPNDRDETIGPNKPFKDLAWGLATQGIAVLRYEKRTKQYADVIATSLENFTVENETITDAIAGVTFLSSYPGINSSQIFLLGHSLGGYLAPRIATQDPTITGLIMLAAPTRPLEDLIIEQVIYLAELDGNITAEEQANIDSVEQQVEQIRTLNISAGEIVLGAPYSYWADLATYNPVSTAVNLSIPMLILQGKRDYQVSYTEDFSVWQHTFANATNVELKAYDGLTHLFMPGTGTPTNTEYTIPNHVAVEVINDIAQWIKS